MAGLVHLPEEFAAQGAAFADGTKTPAEPRDAATVVLLRRGGDGPEVYLLRRQASMEFAGGMCVFPGGSVDPRDFDHTVAWGGPSPAEWASRLGVDEAKARALVCAAVRETFEESGVLLAGESAESVTSPIPGLATRPETTGRPTGSRWRSASSRSPSCCPAAAWCCVPTSSVRGRAGSRRSSSPGATGPGSS